MSLKACAEASTEIQVQAADRALQIGILPINTTRALIKSYEPLHNYLERILGRQVELVTARDFKTFYFNTLSGQYDVIVTAAHLGRLAQTQANYIPLARYKAQHRTLLITAKDHPLQDIHELRGNLLAGIDPVTLAMNESMVWLRSQGLQAGKDFNVQNMPTPVSAAYAVKNHQAILAVGSIQGLNMMPEELRQSIEIFASLQELPSMLWMAHPRMKADIARLKTVLMGFTADTAEGAQFFEATGYQGLREVAPEETATMEHTAQEVKKILEMK